MKRLRIVFMGTPQFAVPALSALARAHEVVAVYTQPEKPVGRGMKMQPSPVKALAETLGIPVYTPEKVSAPEEVERLKSFNADFFVVVAYGQILKSSVFELPKYSCVNIHSSLLPRWRGAAPIHWALLAGDTETGVTTMRIVQKLDAGDIYLQSKTEISKDETATTLHDRLADMGSKLILQTLADISNGTLVGRPQDESLVTYAHKLTKEMGDLNPAESCEILERKVRALNPWPGTRAAVTHELWGEKSFKIKKAQSFKSLELVGAFHEPIANVVVKNGEILWRCKDGYLRLLEIQEDGKKAVLASDFLNGIRARGKKE